MLGDILLDPARTAPENTNNPKKKKKNNRVSDRDETKQIQDSVRTSKDDNHRTLFVLKHVD